MPTREPGYYPVKIEGAWKVLEWTGLEWYSGNPYASFNLNIQDVLPRIELPEPDYTPASIEAAVAARKAKHKLRK